MLSKIYPLQYNRFETDRGEQRVRFPVPWNALRKHDAMHANLPDYPADGHMGVFLPAGDNKTFIVIGEALESSPLNERCGFEFILPCEYLPGGNISVVARSGLLQPLEVATATLDCECWKDNGDGTVSSDLCRTSAINITTPALYADREFVIDGSQCDIGTRLIVRLSFSGSDVVAPDSATAQIVSIALLLDLRR